MITAHERECEAIVDAVSRRHSFSSACGCGAENTSRWVVIGSCSPVNNQGVSSMWTRGDRPTCAYRKALFSRGQGGWYPHH